MSENTANFNVPRVPRGTNDILPTESHLWQTVEEKSRKILSAYNYQEIRTPIFEDIQLFVRSMGQTSDVVSKQMLTLASQKDQDPDSQNTSLALRPEGTASIVRSYINNRFDKIEGLSKLFYIGPMFRGERPQKGRLRQFHQIGAEAIGPGPDEALLPYLDAEMLILSTHILKDLGLNNFTLKINTLGSFESKANLSDYLKAQLNPHLKELCEDCQNRFSKNVFRILDCKNKQCKSITATLKLEDRSWLDSKSLDYYNKVKGLLKEMNVAFVEDTHLVRGLDYYMHTVFEITGASLGSQDALGAGGRYNKLVSDLGGPEVSAIGFALGIERILLALGDSLKSEVRPLDLFMIILDENAFAAGFKLATTLRLQGVGVDINFKVASMKSQMRSADKSNALYAAILGENELKAQTITLKNLKTGNQTSLPIANDDAIKDSIIQRKV